MVYTTNIFFLAYVTMTRLEFLLINLFKHNRGKFLEMNLYMEIKKQLNFPLEQFLVVVKFNEYEG